MATIAPHVPARSTDAEQNAELADLIRRLAAVRPEILNSVPEPRTAPARPAPAPPPAPAPAPAPALAPASPPALAAPAPASTSAPTPLFPPHLTSEDFPRPKEERDRLAHLRALSLGRMCPGDRWPAHADERFRTRMRRPLLRRRVADALKDCARPALAALGAVNLVVGPSLLLLLGQSALSA